MRPWGLLDDLHREYLAANHWYHRRTCDRVAGDPLGENMKKLWSKWLSLPYKLRIAGVTAVVAFVRAKWPGIIPDDLTPDKILGGGALLAILHAATDIAYRGAKK